mmetsp:Transcript_21909/g.59992  ORF Transcript_21909/g.59992 Transcript_21909/m.59992 type:complete len:221 (+) Transcript_21909:193-855(+)
MLVLSLTLAFSNLLRWRRRGFFLSLLRCGTRPRLPTMARSAPRRPSSSTSASSRYGAGVRVYLSFFSAFLVALDWATSRYKSSSSPKSLPPPPPSESEPPPPLRALFAISMPCRRRSASRTSACRSRAGTSASPDSSLRLALRRSWSWESMYSLSERFLSARVDSLPVPPSSRPPRSSKVSKSSLRPPPWSTLRRASLRRARSFLVTARRIKLSSSNLVR